MKVIFEWPEGRELRRTETEIPHDVTWEEAQKYVIAAYKKALKYSTVPLPNGITLGEL